MTSLPAIQAMYVSGHALASVHARPAEALAAGQAGPWTALPVPGHADSRRPFGCLYGQEAPEKALDRVLSEALNQAGLSPAERASVPVLMGTSSLNVGQNEQHLARQIQATQPAPALADARWGFMLDEHCRRQGLHGPQYTFNTACSSSANALLYAQRMLSLDLAKAVVVVGFEAYNGISFGGFHGLMLLSPDGYRPFDPQHEGIILAEGVAAVVLSKTDQRAQARLDGGDSTIDHTGVTVASEDSLVTVMASAMQSAGIEPNDVVAVKAHGTGTPGNDSAEAAAIHRVFGDEAPPYFSLKGCLGHTLGACGLVELISLMDCRREGFIPASTGYRPEGEAKEAQAKGPLSEQRRWPDAGPLLLNYFGFGGNNTSLVVDL